MDEHDLLVSFSEAIESKNWLLAKEYIDKKVDINGTIRGFSALMLACKVYDDTHASKEFVTLLINSCCEVNHFNNLITSDEYSALLIAISKGSIDLVTILVNAGASLDDCIRYKTTPLLLAIQKKNLDIIRFLVSLNAKGGEKSSDCANSVIGSRAVCRIDIDSKAGTTTPLWAAIETDDIEIVQLLLDHGADANLGNIKMETPLMKAIEQQNLDIITLLLSKKPYLYSVTSDRDYPLLLAVKSGNYEVVQLILNAVITAEGEAKVDKLYLMTEAPLAVAVRNNSPRIAELLLQLGANTEVEMDYTKKYTPLMHAVHHHFTEMVRILIAYNANVNAINTYRRAIPTSSFPPGFGSNSTFSFSNSFSFNTSYGSNSTSTIGNTDCNLYSDPYEGLIPREDTVGNTPLMTALQNLSAMNYDITCSLLLCNRCDLSITNVENNTAWDLLKAANHETFLNIKTKTIEVYHWSKLRNYILFLYSTGLVGTENEKTAKFVEFNDVATTSENLSVLQMKIFGNDNLSFIIKSYL